ncbi:MAG: hypothetical protein ACFFC6_06730 [Promethearchaeota archaeon]
MTHPSSTLGTILAIVGFLLPSFFLIWTGTESVVMLLTAGYLFLWGYYDIDLGWFGSTSDSGLHLFNMNWYFDPSNISQGSKPIDGFLNNLATAIYPGNFGETGLSLSGMMFGLSLLIIVIGILLGLIRKENPKISGLLYIIGAAVGLSALLLIWNNATNLTFIGGGVEDNFLPVPLGSLFVLIAGIWNLIKS